MIYQLYTPPLVYKEKFSRIVYLSRLNDFIMMFFFLIDSILRVTFTVVDLKDHRSKCLLLNSIYNNTVTITFEKYKTLFLK